MAMVFAPPVVDPPGSHPKPGEVPDAGMGKPDGESIRWMPTQAQKIQVTRKHGAVEQPGTDRMMHQGQDRLLGAEWLDRYFIRSGGAG